MKDLFLQSHIRYATFHILFKMLLNDIRYNESERLVSIWHLV